MMEELIKKVKSLISDIEAMQTPEEPNWFGSFGTALDEFNEDISKVSIEWSNLAISLEEVKKALTDLT